MPVYDRSYQRWDGEIKRRAFRAAPIVVAGVRDALRAKGGWFWTVVLRLFMGVSCVPTLLLFLVNWFFWFRPSWLPADFFTFFDAVAPYRVIQYPLLTRVNSEFLMIYCVLFGSGLIARDRASGALPLYLSRPLTLSDYVIGKLGVIGWFMALFTLVPNLALWLLGVVADPTPGALRAALPLLFPIVLHNVAVVLTYSLTILAVSSLCRRPMYAGLLWFALFKAVAAITSVAAMHAGQGALVAVSPNDALFSISVQLYDIVGLFERAIGSAEGGAQMALRNVFEAVNFFGASTPLQAWTSVAAWCGLSLAVLVGVLRRQDVAAEAGTR